MNTIQTSFGNFEIKKGKSSNTTDVFYGGLFVMTLLRVNCWDKDTLLKRFDENKHNIINVMSKLNDEEEKDLLKKRVRDLIAENKELKESSNQSNISVNENNVEEIFNQCINLMAQRYNEKGFTTSRGKQILNKYREAI